MADVSLVAIVTAVTAQAEEALARVGALADETAESGSLMGTGLAAAGGIAAAGLLVAAGASVDLAIKNQAATATLSANAGITMSAAQGISKAFLDTAGSTTFSGTQITQAYASVAAQLGATEGHALNAGQAMDVMRAAMDLAEASGSSLDDATGDLAKVMQLYGINVGGAAAASDVLYNSAKLTGNSIDGVTQAVQRIHAQLGDLTPSLSDVGGLLLDLADHGESGRQGLSAVSTAMTTLLGNSKATDAELSTLGLNLFTASGQFVGMGSVIAQLQPILAGMTQAQQLLAVQQLFGKSAGDKLLETILAGPAAYDAATAAVARHGAAHTAAQIQMSTFEGQVKITKAALEDYGVQIGNVLLPILDSLVKKIAEVITWFGKHRGAAEALAIVLGTVLVGAIAAYIASMVIAASATAIATAGISVALGALALFAVYLATHWQQVWADIKQWTAEAQTWINSHILLILAIPIVGWIIVVAANWQTAWGAIKDAVSIAWGIIKPIFDVIQSNVAAIGGDITTAIGVWNSVWGTASGSISAAWSVIKPIFDAIKAALGALSGDASSAGGALGAVVNAASSAVGIVGKAASAVASAAGGIASAGASALHAIGLAQGGVVPAVPGGTLVNVGEAGYPEAIVPLSQYNAGNSSNSSGPSQPTTINLIINGQTFSSAILPDLLSTMYQNKRQVVTLQLG